MGDMKGDKVLDLRGWSCPWCILKAKSWLARMDPGQVLEVLSTDPNVLKNFPLVLERTGDRILRMDQADDHFQIRVLRGNAEGAESDMAGSTGDISIDVKQNGTIHQR
jgi:tRNA 2-thiouridine synthesizing protein A